MSLDLSKHIAALREKENKQDKTVASANNLLFWGTAADKNYLAYLKPCVGSATVFVRLEKVETLTILQMYCDKKGITKVVSSSPSLLEKLLKWDKRKAPSLSNYAGSYFTIPTLDRKGTIEIVFIQPLKQLVTVTYGKFMTTRIVSKLLNPSKWFVATKFDWYILSPDNIDTTFENFKDAFLISIDAETFKENAVIRCLSYTAFFYDSSEPSGLRSVSVVLPLDSEWALAWMRKFNWELKSPKVFQNGKYDLAYFARYSAPVYNYKFDTANMFHSWYSELPKDLGFLNAFLIRDAVYWKDLSETDDLYEYYRYNALDTWGTGNALLAMLLELPEYAINNYVLEFPLVFPCHMAEMRGIERDMSKLEAANSHYQAIITEHQTKLNTILGIPAGQSFNVNSPIQMKALLKILGCQDLKSADEKNLKKAMFRHPLNTRILDHVLEIRKARKLISTYITAGKEFHRLDGTGNRILFAINPHGTDSARLASREHHFWCGLQIQNIPRGKSVKQTLMADEGFELAEVDYSQAESRDTGYISGDEKLIDAVEHSPDFHSQNCSAFFGIPFDELWDSEAGESLNKALRDLAKRVNHGANYNMGAGVLIETMGIANVLQAKHLLNLPRVWSLKEVAEYLLAQFHKAYPDIRENFHKGVVREVLTTNRLTSTALFNITSQEEYVKQWDEGVRSWVRHCFGDPAKSKNILNSYISHPPQSLNGITLNKAWMKVFYTIAIHPEYRDNFKLVAQIHDSIFFQYRKGHEYLCDMVAKAMEIPITIKGYDGQIRTFTVPAEPAAGGKYWSDIKG